MVYAGEYAAHDTQRRNTLRSALAEAAYLTSLERNGDIVHLASYAPLLARRSNTQWTPDLIYFDSTHVFRTLNYTVQELFSRNRGDLSLPTTLTPAPGPTHLAASAVRDRRTGDIILKLVNGDNAPHALILQFAGTHPLPATATRTIFASPSADSVNEDGAPPAVTPQTSVIPLGPELSYHAPANSLTILRLSAPAH